jgi:hypothetical protein
VAFVSEKILIDRIFLGVLTRGELCYIRYPKDVHGLGFPDDTFRIHGYLFNGYWVGLNYLLDQMPMCLWDVLKLGKLFRGTTGALAGRGSKNSKLFCVAILGVVF